MHTDKPQLRVVSAIICFIAVALLAVACGSGYRASKDPSTLCDAYTSGKEETETTTEQSAESHALFVQYSYADLFERQPNYNWIVVANLWKENGRRSKTTGIIINVSEKVEQSALPVEDRVPDCIEGVPVQIVEEGDLAEGELERMWFKFLENISRDNVCLNPKSNPSGKENEMTTENTDERIHEVRLKCDALFWRQPNVHAVGEGWLLDENGELTKTRGIKIRVTKKVEQSTLPREDRIPDCLDGVPVQIVEEERAVFW